MGGREEEEESTAKGRQFASLAPLRFTPSLRSLAHSLLTVVIDTHAGNSMRRSSAAPDRYSTHEQIYAISAFVVSSRTTVAEGVYLTSHRDIRQSAKK